MIVRHTFHSKSAASEFAVKRGIDVSRVRSVTHVSGSMFPAFVYAVIYNVDVYSKELQA